MRRGSSGPPSSPKFSLSPSPPSPSLSLPFSLPPSLPLPPSCSPPLPRHGPTSPGIRGHPATHTRCRVRPRAILPSPSRLFCLSLRLLILISGPFSLEIGMIDFLSERVLFVDCKHHKGFPCSGRHWVTQVPPKSLPQTSGRDLGQWVSADIRTCPRACTFARPPA